MEEFQVFIKNSDASSHSANVYTQPIDLHRFGSVNYNKGFNSPEIEIVSAREYTEQILSPLTAPTSNFPIAKYKQDKVTVFPKVTNTYTNNDVTFNYIRKPNDVVWGYGVNTTLGNYVWDGTPGFSLTPVIPSTGSVNFEISDSQQTDVIIEILKYAGVVIRDPQIVQSATQLSSANEANTKR